MSIVQAKPLNASAEITLFLLKRRGKSIHLLQDLPLSSMPSKIIPSSIIIRHKFRSRIDNSGLHKTARCRGHAMRRFAWRRRSMRLAVLGLVFFLVASACSQEDDAAAIQALVQKGAALAEAHDISGLMELTTADIVGQPGAYNRPAIKRIIWMALQHYGPINILYPKPSVTLLAEDQASCGVFLLIVKKDRVIPDLKDLYDDPQGWIETVGDNADLYQLKLEMRKEDDRWRVREAER